MNHWVTIMTFQFSHEAHLVKTKLEDEGINVNLLDEFINQIQPIYAAAAGGIKMQVRSDDVIKAKYILNELGLIKDSGSSSIGKDSKLDQLTSKIPLLNRLTFEARVLIIIAILFTAILLPVFLVG